MWMVWRDGTTRRYTHTVLYYVQSYRQSTESLKYSSENDLHTAHVFATLDQIWRNIVVEFSKRFTFLASMTDDLSFSFDRCGSRDEREVQTYVLLWYT